MAKEKELGNGIYKNKNGYLTLEEVQKIGEEGRQYEWMKNFSTVENKCPPKFLKDKTIMCFRCSDCWKRIFNLD